MGKRQLAGIFLLVTALQILPISDALAKSLSASLPVLQVIWARFFFHCLATGAYTAWRHGPRLLLPTVSWVLTARSCALCFAVGLFYVALHHMPMTTALTLWFVEPFLLTILAMVVFKEKVVPLQWLAVTLGFLGIVLAIRPSADNWQWSYLIGLAAGMGYAVFLLLTRVVESRIPAIVSVYQTGLVGCILSSVAVLSVWQEPSMIQWLQLVAIGCVAALAHLLIVRAFERAEASLLSPFTYAEVITATILGYLVFGDVPDRWAYAGLALIILSAIAVVPREPRREAAAQT